MNKENWPSETGRHLFLVETDRSHPQDLVDWAIAQLELGIETDSLFLLAGADLSGAATTNETYPLFRQVLSELEIVSPNFEELCHFYIKDMARAIVEGNIQPQAALSRIHNELICPQDHPPEFQAWCDMWMDLDPHKRIPMTNVNETVIQYAKDCLSS